MGSGLPRGGLRRKALTMCRRLEGSDWEGRWGEPSALVAAGDLGKCPGSTGEEELTFCPMSGSRVAWQTVAGEPGVNGGSVLADLLHQTLL